MFSDPHWSRTDPDSAFCLVVSTRIEVWIRIKTCRREKLNFLHLWSDRFSMRYQGSGVKSWTFTSMIWKVQHAVRYLGTGTYKCIIEWLRGGGGGWGLFFICPFHSYWIRTQKSIINVDPDPRTSSQGRDRDLNPSYYQVNKKMLSKKKILLRFRGDLPGEGNNRTTGDHRVSLHRRVRKHLAGAVTSGSLKIF